MSKEKLSKENLSKLMDKRKESRKLAFDSLVQHVADCLEAGGVLIAGKSLANSPSVPDSHYLYSSIDEHGIKDETKQGPTVIPNKVVEHIQDTYADRIMIRDIHVDNEPGVYSKKDSRVRPAIFSLNNKVALANARQLEKWEKRIKTKGAKTERFASNPAPVVLPPAPKPGELVEANIAAEVLLGKGVILITRESRYYYLTKDQLASLDPAEKLSTQATPLGNLQAQAIQKEPLVATAAVALHFNGGYSWSLMVFKRHDPELSAHAYRFTKQLHTSCHYEKFTAEFPTVPLLEAPFSNSKVGTLKVVRKPEVEVEVEEVEFKTLELMDIFEYRYATLPSDYPIQYAVKVGNSTAIIHINVDPNNLSILNSNNEYEKVRFKKTTMVTRIFLAPKTPDEV